MSDVSFADLGLAEPLLRALDAAKYTVPTPIQARTIPALLQGRDVLGIAQTGTGKTAAFALPVLQHLSGFRERAQPKSPRALVLAPTRELAVQIARSFDTYGRGLGLRSARSSAAWATAARSRPWRAASTSWSPRPAACSTWSSAATSSSAHVTFLVLDEADRMFDMGFIRDVRRIVGSVSKQRQTLLFSATMPGDIAKLASEILKNPERVEIAPQGRTVDKIDQRVYFVSAGHQACAAQPSAVRRARSSASSSSRAPSAAPTASPRRWRTAACAPRRSTATSRRTPARRRSTTSAAAGPACWSPPISPRAASTCSGVTHVINYELPADAESYVHRIGRTARAGASGVALSFCDGSERGQLKASSG